MKPDHFREADPKLCQYCKHIYRSYHHCDSCSDCDEYSCKKHDDFLIGSEGAAGMHICDDFEENL
jgi:hypothetical protein